jgi:tetratricopeptide (TPR) repeat protein
LHGIAAVLAGAAACTPVAESDLRIEYAGCPLVRNGDACVVPEDGRLVLWIEGGDATSVRLTGATVMNAADVLGGRQLLIEIARGAQRIVARDDANASWTLALVPPDRPAWLEEAVRLLDGQPAAARELALPPSRDAADPQRADALGVLARVALRQAAWREAEGLLREALLAHRAAGNVSEEVRNAGVLVWLLIERGRFAEAASVLANFPRGSGLPGEVAVFEDFYAGMLAKEANDARDALEHTATALERAERLDLQVSQTQVRQLLGEELQALGRSAEARDNYELLLADARRATACEGRSPLGGAAWLRLLECEAGPCVPPVAELEQVEALHEDSSCPVWPAEHLNTVVNLALAYYHAGRWDEARRTLDHARGVDPDPALRYLVWIHDIEGRLEIQAGRLDEALDTYARLGEAAEQLETPEARWRALVGKARVLDALARPEAIDAYEEAERVLEAESLRVPLHEGRDTFVARRERATREYLALLLDRGNADDAFAVARRARARVLRGARLDASLAALSPEIEQYLTDRAKIETELPDIWTLSSASRRKLEAQRTKLQHDLLDLLDRVSLTAAATITPGDSDFRSLPDGAVALLYHPLPDGWVGFAADARGAIARRLTAPAALRDDAAALSDALLAPFGAQIEKSQAVRLLPYGVLRGLDLHALPFGGDAMVMAKPTEYGLDLPDAVRAERKSRLALLVGNPTGDLPGAAAEIAEIAGTFDDTWDVETLIGPAATSEALRSLIPRAALFHYAGHAVFRGRGGWDSELPLADNTSLGIEDILALEHVPQWVVLSSCRGAGTAADSAGEGMGVAQAFLLAGATAVVAPVRNVADRDTSVLIGSLYREWRVSGDLRVGLQRAQRELRSRAPGADWASFRVMVR